MAMKWVAQIPDPATRVVKPIQMLRFGLSR